jgi:hypothetical protein
MFRLGFTMEEVGRHFHLTRQRIHQILRQHKVAAGEGGQAVMTPEKWERLRKRR